MVFSAIEMSESHIIGSLGSGESEASTEGPKCYYDLRAKSTIAFTDENFGRRFWGCVKFKVSVFFFNW